MPVRIREHECDASIACPALASPANGSRGKIWVKAAKRNVRLVHVFSINAIRYLQRADTNVFTNLNKRNGYEWETWVQCIMSVACW